MGPFALLVTPIPTPDLARETGKSETAARAWKNGALPREQLLAGIARAAGIPLDRVREAYALDVADRGGRRAPARRRNETAAQV